MKSVLIIDGSDAIATSSSELFWKRGWKLAFCVDRDSALNRLVSIERYDVVILGYSVPDIGAVQLVRFIRALEHRKTTAVMMMAASAEVTMQAIAAGADEILPRPIRPHALMWALDKHAP